MSRRVVAVLVPALLVACGGGSSQSGAPADDGPGRPAIVNGFVETGSITRDARGTLLSESSKRVDTANDRLVETGRDVVNGVTYESIIAYDEAGDLVREDYRESRGFTALDVYEHDGRGFLQRRTSTYGGFVDVETFEYDAAGRLSARQTRAGEGDAPLVERTDYAYGADGLPVSARELIAGGTADENGERVDLLRRKTYAHDADGRRIGVSIDDFDDGSIDRALAYEYDDDGNMIRNVLSGADGAVIETREYAYEAVDEPIFNRWLRVFRYFF